MNFDYPRKSKYTYPSMSLKNNMYMIMIENVLWLPKNRIKHAYCIILLNINLRFTIFLNCSKMLSEQEEQKSRFD